MADRYWIGGTGTWNATSTTNWSTTSGGPGGASVPGTGDNVFFDQAGTYTVTLTGALACLDFNVSAGAITFASTGTLAISGSMSVTNVTPTWSGTGLIVFTGSASSKTITTNGISFAAPFTFNGIGSVWTLGSAFTSTSISAFSLTNGTLDTSAVGNWSLSTAGVVNIASSSTAILNLNASTVTLSSTTSATFGANCILNAGTSTINITTTTSNYTFAGGGKTFYNVNFTGAQNASSKILAITGSNTFNNLSVTGPSVDGFISLTFAANQIINGVLSTNGTVANRRVFFQSSTFGMQWHLFCNSAASLTDADFRDLYVKGTASPISGTRIGDLKGCLGITFSTPKTVYRLGGGSGNWSQNAWSDTTGGAISLNNFPLAQDIAIIDGNSGLSGAIITLDSTSVSGFPTIDASNRTTRTTTFDASANPTVYGNWINGTGITISGTGTITFAGRNTQTITSAGKNFTAGITINSPGGTVELADAIINTGSVITITNGTFNSGGYNITTGQLASNVTTVRTINLGASGLSLSGTSPININPTNLTFDAGTSIIFLQSSTATITTDGGAVGTGLTFYDVSFNSTLAFAHTLRGVNVFNYLSINSTANSGVNTFNILANQTIDTLATIPRLASRIFIRSNTLGTPITLTVNSFDVYSFDFRDIIIAGAATGTLLTGCGDCGGNSGITFPTPKTSYWNLAAGGNWSSQGWAFSPSGTPQQDNFPLAQDTAIIVNTGLNVNATITMDAAWNIGTINMSGRTTAMSLTTGATLPNIHGNWLFGSGVNFSGTGQISFVGRGTQTITSNGKQFTQPVAINTVSGTVQLADALSIASTSTLTLTSGTFDAVTYNVSIGLFSSTVSNRKVLKMGSGIWTLTGTGTVWNITVNTIFLYYSGTATIVLSNMSTTARTWTGGGLYYNKLTIGGAFGISTTTFSSADTFGELASIKTVAHTVALSGGPSIGLWSITGTVGNVVTITGTINLVGARVSGVNYLALGTTTVTATNPVEFYAGVNSTGTGINTAAPAAVIRYWRGGTGTWNATTTTNWSASSGGAGGASVPTSADTVIFNGASNATAYTVTLTATQLRCASLSVSGPASGNITFAGNASLSITEAFTMASTGITRTYNGSITLSGTGVGKTISVGQTLASTIAIKGVNSSWALTSALINGNVVTLTNGSFNTANFVFTPLSISTSARNPISLSLGSSTVTIASDLDFTGSVSTLDAVNFTFNAGTSTIIMTGAAFTFYHAGKTFYNVSFTQASAAFSFNLNQSIFTPTFNNLTLTMPTLGTGIRTVSLSSNIIINGTFGFTASAGANRRLFIASDIIGTQRTITAAALSGLSDVDFRDVNCAGAATWTGTRIGDCGGNTNAPVSTPKTVYWSLVAGGSWSSTAWATGSGGTPAVVNFPLAQDTAIIENTGLNTSATIIMDNTIGWNVGTVNMSTRTNAMTFSFSNPMFIYGNWTFGTGVTASATGLITFSGRGTQTITSNGKAFTSSIVINSVTGTVQLADAFLSSFSGLGITLTSGTFNAALYNVTIGGFSTGAGATRTLSMGSGTWSITTSGTSWAITAAGLTLNKDTANILISVTSGSISFIGGGFAYNKLTIGGGTNNTLFSIGGNNTFTEIASTRTVAYIISLLSSTQTVGAFTASGSAGNLVTISGSTITSFATLIYTGATTVSVNYIIPTFLKVYSVTDTWYANDSINAGSYGWVFASGVVAYSVGGLFFAFF